MEFKTEELETCTCGSQQWKLDRCHFDLHGFKIVCSKCNKFLRWTGKEKAKRHNPAFAARHRANSCGVRFCDLCGLSEDEAKLFGWHFTTDHRLAEEFGGEDTLENSRSLCSPCHYLKTALEHRTRGLKKYLEKK